MTKKTRKSPTKPKAKKRVRLGKIARILKQLDDWYTAGKTGNPQGRKAGTVAIMQFVRAHVEPYEQRGDHYLEKLSAIGHMVGAKSPDPKAIVDAVECVMKELNDLVADRETRLNYDDMREALRKVIEGAQALNPEHVAQVFHDTYEKLAPLHGYETRKESAVTWEKVPEKNKKLMVAVCNELLAQMVEKLVECGVGKAFHGSPASDLGRMRSALQATDRILTEMLQRMDEKTPRSVVTFLWELVHGARGAMASAPGPDKLELRHQEYSRTRDAFLDVAIVAGDAFPQREMDDLLGGAADRVKRIVDERDKLRRDINVLQLAVTANDPSGGWGLKSVEHACNLIMEAISLRAFFKEMKEQRDMLRSCAVLRGRKPPGGVPGPRNENHGWPTPLGEPYVEVASTVKSTLHQFIAASRLLGEGQG